MPNYSQESICDLIEKIPALKSNYEAGGSANISLADTLYGDADGVTTGSTMTFSKKDFLNAGFKV